MSNSWVSEILSFFQREFPKHKVTAPGDALELKKVIEAKRAELEKAAAAMTDVVDAEIVEA